jgi:hypothetical protein
VIVAIVIAAAVIVGAIIVVAMGKGGELSRERAELPSRADFRSWSDVADYRPPAALMGYHAAATERALALIARTIAERDAEIDWLRRRLAELQPESLATAQAGPSAGLAGEDSAEDAADEDLPAATARWQARSTAGSGVASGFAASQPVFRVGGDDE